MLFDIFLVLFLTIISLLTLVFSPMLYKKFSNKDEKQEEINKKVKFARMAGIAPFVYLIAKIISLIN